MKKRIYLFATCLLIITAGAILVSCSSDDDQDVGAPKETDVNVLLIESDNGKTSKGLMYENNESYNPPYCYLEEDLRYDGVNPDPITFYYMGFRAYIKESDVIETLTITFESNHPMSFSDLKAGDTFDSSQFNAQASLISTWKPSVFITAAALSGNITVIGTKNDGDKNYIVLKLTNLRFKSIDSSCIYTVNGTVEYEILS